MPDSISHIIAFFTLTISHPLPLQKKTKGDYLVYLFLSFQFSVFHFMELLCILSFCSYENLMSITCSTLYDIYPFVDQANEAQRVVTSRRSYSLLMVGSRLKFS